MAEPAIPLGWFEGLVALVGSFVIGWLKHIHSKVMGLEESRNTERDDLYYKIKLIELDLAKNYHTKPELRDALKEAMDPLKEAIKELRMSIEKMREEE